MNVDLEESQKERENKIQTLRLELCERASESVGEIIREMCVILALLSPLFNIFGGVDRERESERYGESGERT